MPRSYNCRYCQKAFIPQRGKPGYIDECPNCLHDKTRVAAPVDFVARFLARYPKRRRAFTGLRKALISIGIDEAEVDDVIADSLKRSGTQI